MAAPSTVEILKQIETFGYMCVSYIEDKTIVMVAEPMVPFDDPKYPRRFRQMVRIVGTDEGSRLQAARQLALQCGVNLGE